MVKTYSGHQPTGSAYEQQKKRLAQHTDTIDNVIRKVHVSIENKVKINATTLQSLDIIATDTLMKYDPDLSTCRRVWGAGAITMDPSERQLAINMIKEIAVIVFRNKFGEKEHAALATKIRDLEKLQSERNLFTGNEAVREYCKTLTNEWIIYFKKTDKAKIEGKISRAEPMLGQLTEEQYELLIKQNEKLDNFFNHLDKALITTINSPKKVYDHSRFARIWSLGLMGIDREKRDLKKHRASRIEALDESAKHLPKELVRSSEAYDHVKANLEFILAITILAKEMNRASPNKKEIEKANKILQESKKFSKPAAIASQFNFNDWKTFHMNKTEINDAHQEILKAIKESGCEKFVSKRDLDDVFKIMTTDPKIRKRKENIKILKTISAVLTLPIAWTVAAVSLMVFMLFVLSMGWFLIPIIDAIKKSSRKT